ncbi:MAG: RNA-binding protein YhbY [bacterium]|nr:RNA-binding protein YhbY [bacterium]
MPLTGKQKRYLRGLGHELKPVVQIGQQGLDERVLAAIAKAIAAHELVKIKLLESYVVNRHETAERLAMTTGAEVVQVLGRTILLYQPAAENPQIKLP